MFGLMRLSDISATKNGQREKVKNDHTGRSRHKVGSLYREDNIVFFIV
jgi:hypothetical protein